MELLPIIYTTLLIFSGLTVVTIIFSYVSYKIRKSAKEEVAAAKAKSEPKVKPPQIKKISSQSKKKEIHSNSEFEKKSTSSSSSHSEHRKEPVERSGRTSSNSKSSSTQKKKVPIKPRKNRIEILNKPTRTTEDFSVGNGQRSSNRRFDIHQETKDQAKSTKNLFDNYVEDDEDFRPLR